MGQPFFRLRPGFFFTHTLNFQRDGDIVDYLTPRQKYVFLRHVGGITAHDVVPFPSMRTCPVIGPGQSGNDVQQGTLSGAARSDDAHKLP